MLLQPHGSEVLSFNAIAANPTQSPGLPLGYNWIERAISERISARPWFYLDASNDLVGDADPGSFPKPAATDVLVSLPAKAWSRVALLQVAAGSSGVSRGEILAPEAWPTNGSGVSAEYGTVDTRADNKGFAGVALHNAAAGEYVLAVVEGYCPYALIQATGGADTIAAGDQLNCATEVFGFAVVAQSPAFAIATEAKAISTAQDAQEVWIVRC